MGDPKLSRLELQIMDVLWRLEQGFYSRNSGELSRKAPTRVHHHPDHGLPPRNEEGASAGSRKSETFTFSKPQFPATSPSASWWMTCSPCSADAHNL